MATQITMPKLGLSMKTGKVSKWLKNEGDKIKKGDALVEIATEKITNKIESRVEGVLLKIAAPKGAVLPIGALLGVIGLPDEDIADILAPAAKPASGSASVAASQGPAGRESGERVKISPAARTMAEEHGIDYTRITGTGPEGRITKEDVAKAIEEGLPAEEEPTDDRPVQKVIPYEGMRRAIGDNMAKSSTTNAAVTHHAKVNMTGLLAFRKQINEGVSDKEKISVTAILTKAVARTLDINPILNASLIGDEIRIWQDIHVGIAVAIPDGLIVPVVRNTNTKRLADVNKEIADLAKRSRKNKLSLDEMTGGTFTITNLGSYGSVDFFTPIINPPESAILGVGRMLNQPAVIDGQIVICPMMGLSLTFDHRLVDGAPAAEWLGMLIGFIENPTRIFI